MDFKDTFFSRNLSINCKGKRIDFTYPVIMGIVNLTPDSFYDGGKYTDIESVEKRIDELIKEGANILDFGAFSSRPGASEVSEEEEWKRLSPALKLAREKYPDKIFSVDTFRSSIAKKALEEYGIDIINDITGGDADPKMYDLIAESKTPYIIMHMKGTPFQMEKNPVYDDIVDDLLNYFRKKTEILLSKGVNDIIIDPGFGFGKNMKDNYKLLSSLEVFQLFEMPVLIGISRKSLIKKLLGISHEQSLNSKTALHMYSLTKGASVLRVHDVREALECINLYKELKKHESEA